MFAFRSLCFGALLLLGGCVAYPVGYATDGYYGGDYVPYTYYGAPAYVAPPVVVAPYGGWRGGRSYGGWHGGGGYRGGGGNHAPSQRHWH